MALVDFLNAGNQHPPGPSADEQRWEHIYITRRAEDARRRTTAPSPPEPQPLRQPDRPMLAKSAKKRRRPSAERKLALEGDALRLKRRYRRTK